MRPIMEMILVQYSVTAMTYVWFDVLAGHILLNSVCLPVQIGIQRVHCLAVIMDPPRAVIQACNTRAGLVVHT